MNTYAWDINELSYSEMYEKNYSNTKVYIPKELSILNHNITLTKLASNLNIPSSSDLLTWLKNKIWYDKFKKLIDDNYIYVIWQGGSWNGKENNMIGIYNEITFNRTAKKDSIIKYYSINKDNFYWYTEAKFAPNYPTIFLYDEAFLPQNIFVEYEYTKEIKDWNPITSSQRLGIERKYDVIKFKNSLEEKESYALIPYYEILLPSLEDSMGNTLHLTYYIDEDYFFTNYLKFNLLNDWKYNPLIEFVTY